MLIRTRSALAAGTAVAVLAALTGCSSDEGADSAPREAAGTASSTATSSARAYLDVPDDIDLTEPGAALALGEDAVVAVERRQDEVAVLGLRVDRIEQTTFEESFPGWSVDEATAARTPYFVRVTVTNLGPDDLAAMPFDSVLWGNDGATLEAANNYTAEQLPVCPGGPLPTPFDTDATAELCVVYYIAQGRTLENVAFLPFGGLDAVTWTGETSPVSKPSKPGKPGVTLKPEPTPPAGSIAPSDQPTVSVPTQEAT